MAGFLGDLLNAREPNFTYTMAQLEEASGRPSADVRLITDITDKLHRKKRELGLDPKDTTGSELYHALLDLVRRHDGFVVAAIGGGNPGDADSTLGRLPQVVKKLTANPKVLVLKHSVAKRLLQKMPPKALMKYLGYRSVDSMLKREPLGQIYAGLQLAEKPQWQRRFLQSYKQLEPSDYEMRPVEIIQLTGKRWEKLAADFRRVSSNHLLCLKDVGVLAILPLSAQYLPGAGLATLALLLHYVNELRIYSSYIKFGQVRPDFGQFIVNSLVNDLWTKAQLANQPLSWRIIQRLYGRRSKNRQPEIFEPHVQSEDLLWENPGDVLYKLEPALLFWQDLDYVGTTADNQPISLNLLDTVLNYCNGLAYGQQTARHFQASLYDELLSRYLAQPAFEQQVLRQLDDEPESELMFQTTFAGGRA